MVRGWSAYRRSRGDRIRTRAGRDRGGSCIYEAAVESARHDPSSDRFASAWAEGAELSLEDALAYAGRGRGERRRPARSWASLTPTELEVVKLVGEHLTNPEIAARMFV